MRAQTDPAGLTTRFAYTGENFSPLGGTTTVTDPHSNTTIEQYDNGFLMQVTKAAGTAAQSTASYTYDPATLGITTATDGDGHTTTTIYNSTGQPTSVTDPLGHTTTYTYNALQEPLTTTTPLKRTTTRTYDGQGNLTSRTDAEGDTLTYQHTDPSHPGDVTAVVDPEGRTETLTYDNDGDIATRSRQRREGMTDTTAYLYDNDSEQVCEAPPDSTAEGTKCATSGPRNAGTATTAYNADGEITASTDAAGHTTGYEYDADGNQAETSGPEGEKTLTSYDPDSRVLTRTTAAHTGTESTTKHAYDIPAGQTPCVGTPGASYCETSTDPNGHTTVDYLNALNELIATTRPGGDTTSYGYDPAGNRTTFTDPQGRTTSYRYDAANRETEILYSDGTTPNVEYGYDSDGNRTTMRDGTGTSTYQYDNDDRLTGHTEGSGARISHRYDKAGNITQITYPNGKTVTKSYDDAGQLEAVTDWLGHTTTFGYDANGNVTSTTYPDGDTIASRYSQTNTLLATSVSSASRKTLAGISYARNESELLSSETTTKLTSNGPYTYDAQQRLTTAASSKYGYDPAGNPTDLAGVTQSYNAEDELTSSSDGITYRDDAEGERTTSTPTKAPGVRYGYDQAGRLTETAGFDAPVVKSIKPSTGPAAGGTTVTIKGEHLENATAVTFGGVPATAIHIASGKSIAAVSPTGSGTVDIQVADANATSAPVAGDQFSYSGTASRAAAAQPSKKAVASPATSYGYDGDGLRTSQTTGATATRYTWDTTTSVPEVTSDGTNSYIYGPDGLPIEQISSNETPSYFLHDAIGSTRALLGSAGTVVATYNYTPYGAPAKSKASVQTPLLYAGGYTDQTTGLVYLIHRYYDPTTGQFLTIDPYLAATEAPYSYASDDPVGSV